jgi:COP9 signalosome complex subunit 7
LKLRQLSLLTLARDRANLTYSALQKALGLSDRRALEDLIISAIYAGLLDATLDPYRGAVQVNSLAPLRDLAPGSIPPMIKSLNAWSDRCTSTLRELEEQMASIRNEAARRHTYRESREQKLAKALEELKDQELGGQRKLAVGHAANLLAKNQRYNKRGSGSMMDGPEDIDDEAMDVDDEDDDVGEKKRASRRKL